MSIDYFDLENPKLIAVRDELNQMHDSIMKLYPMLLGPKLKILIEPCENEIFERHGAERKRFDYWITSRILRDIKKTVLTRDARIKASVEWEGVPLKLHSVKENQDELVLVVHKTRTR